MLTRVNKISTNIIPFKPFNLSYQKGGHTWEPSDFLIALLVIDSFDLLSKTKQHMRLTMTMIIERMGRRILTLEAIDGPKNIIQWNRFYNSADFKLPLQESPDQGNWP